MGQIRPALHDVIFRQLDRRHRLLHVVVGTGSMSGTDIIDTLIEYGFDVELVGKIAEAIRIISATQSTSRSAQL